VDWLAGSIDAKLDRAEHHLRVIQEIVESGAVTNLVTTRTDRDRQGRVRVRIKQVGEIPDDWRVVIGECAHDMRSALDHLAYGLNIIGSGDDPPPNASASQFPIYSERLAYRTGRTKDGRSVRPAEPLIRCFPRGARTRVERLQPYRGRKNDPFSVRRLADLRDLSNIDKHRRLPVTAATPDSVGPPRKVEGHRVGPWAYHYRVLKPGATILWLEVPTLPRDVKEPDVDFHFEARIEFEGTSANPPVGLLRPHEPVAFTLEMILRFIRERVLPDFEPWVPDLALILRHIRPRP
jgi:hypothetical protein